MNTSYYRIQCINVLVLDLMVIYIVSMRFEGDKRPYDRFVTYFQQTLRFFRVIFGLNHSNRVEL